MRNEIISLTVSKADAIIGILVWSLIAAAIMSVIILVTQFADNRDNAQKHPKLYRLLQGAYFS